MSDRTPPLPDELREMGVEWHHCSRDGWGLVCDGHADLHMCGSEIQEGPGKRWPHLAWGLVGMYCDWTPDDEPTTEPTGAQTVLDQIREIVDLPAGCGAAEIVERVTAIKYDGFKLRQAEDAAGVEIERQKRIARLALELVGLLRGVQQ